jgi:hypothetical protein
MVEGPSNLQSSWPIDTRAMVQPTTSSSEVGILTRQVAAVHQVQALADEAVRACPGGGGHSAGGQRSAKSGSDIQRLKEQLVDLSRQLEEEVRTCFNIG